MIADRMRQLRLAELYALLALVFLVGLFVLRTLLQTAPQFVLPAAGGMVAVVAMLFGGTRLMLPVYFLTTFGTVIALPGVPPSISLNRVAAALLLGAALLETPAVRHRFLVTPAVALFAAFQLYYLPVSMVLAPPEIDFPIESLFYILIAVVLATRFWRESWMRSISWAILLTSVLAVVVPGTIELIVGRNITVSGVSGRLLRLNGLSVNAIVFAFTAVFAMPFGMFLALESRSFAARLVALGSVGALGVLALLTLNRQTPIIMAGVFLVFVALIRSSYRAHLLGIVVLIGLVAAPVVGAKVVERFSKASDFRKDPSLAVRRDKALIAYEMIGRNAWLGVGHNHYHVLFKDYRPKGQLYILPWILDRHQYIDLGYLQILTEYGIIGSVLVMLLFIYTGIMFFRAYRHSLGFSDTFWTNLLAALAAVFAQLLISMLIQDTFVTPRTYILFGLFFAACAGIEHRLERGNAA